MFPCFQKCTSLPHIPVALTCTKQSSRPGSGISDSRTLSSCAGLVATAMFFGLRVRISVQDAILIDCNRTVAGYLVLRCMLLYAPPEPNIGIHREVGLRCLKPDTASNNTILSHRQYWPSFLHSDHADGSRRSERRNTRCLSWSFEWSKFAPTILSHHRPKIELRSS
jgi:hypothetical protein